MKAIVSLCLIFSLSCGTNVFKAAEKADPAADATVAIEQKKPDKAIRILEDALKDDPENWTLVSLLSSAIAQKFGIDLIRVILKMALPEEEEEATTTTTTTTDGAADPVAEANEVTFLFDALPDPTEENLAGLESAISTLESIPELAMTDADNFKATVFYTSRLGLRTKQFDTDGDGLVSPVELLSMSDDAALDILESLYSAEASIQAGTADNEQSAASSQQISNIKDQIESQPGETQAEKLRNYLGNADASADTAGEAATQ